MARVILGVGAGIAAYKACELLRLLKEAGHRVPADGERHPGGQPGGADDRIGQGDQGVQGGPARVGRQDVEP